MLPVLNNSGTEGSVFMQDNASCQKTKGVTSLLQEGRVEIFGWSAQSPDLSPTVNLRKIHGQTWRPKIPPTLKIYGKNYRRSETKLILLLLYTSRCLLIHSYITASSRLVVLLLLYTSRCLLILSYITASSRLVVLLLLYTSRCLLIHSYITASSRLAVLLLLYTSRCFI